jgi:hypothetical protein
MPGRHVLIPELGEKQPIVGCADGIGGGAPSSVAWEVHLVSVDVTGSASASKGSSSVWKQFRDPTGSALLQIEDVFLDRVVHTPEATRGPRISHLTAATTPGGFPERKAPCTAHALHVNPVGGAHGSR